MSHTSISLVFNHFHCQLTITQTYISFEERLMGSHHIFMYLARLVSKTMQAYAYRNCTPPTCTKMVYGVLIKALQPLHPASNFSHDDAVSNSIPEYSP